MESLIDGDRIGDSGVSLKRRKEKENINKELMQNEKQKAEQKRKTVKFDWQQTNSEVTVRLFVGNHVNSKDVTFSFNDDCCTVTLPDGRTWNCELYGTVLAEGMSITDKGNKLILKMVKRVPEHWNSLERPDDVFEEDKTESQETKDHKEEQHEEKPIVEIPHVNHDIYEKTPDTLTVHIFVKNILKDALSVKFEETYFVVKFQTSDPKFLAINNRSDDTTFVWRVNVKNPIYPDLCRAKSTPTKIEIVLRKQISQRWNTLETLSNKDSAVGNVSSSLSRAQSLSVTEVASKPSLTDSDMRPNTLGMSFTPRKETKPVCMVSPLNNMQNLELVPGMTGLDNLGNTCFMNSVLQCLANTREFRDYFIDGDYRLELNDENPLGMGGRLAECFSVLMKALWASSNRSYAPDKLKTIIGKKASQFTGFAQHDAQEFMAFLLDGLHEDLNRVKNKPYTENIDEDGRSDELVAEESWKLYKKRNDSVVVDLFQGQYKSKLVCPDCNKVSITFDPFLYLSLPLPKKICTRPVYFFSKDHHRKPVQYHIQLTHKALVEELTEKIAILTRTKPKNLRVFEVFHNKVYKFFGSGTTLPDIFNREYMFVFEVLDEKLAGEPILELLVCQRLLMPHPVTTCSNCSCSKAWPTDGTKLRRCTHCYRVGYCNSTCQKEHWIYHRSLCKRTPESVGVPFIVSLPKSKATFLTLCRMAEAYSRYSVNVFQPPVQRSLSTRHSSERLSQSPDSGDILAMPQNSDLPSYAATLDSTSASTSQETATEKSVEKSTSESCYGTEKSFMDEEKNIFFTAADEPQTRVVFGHPSEGMERMLPHFNLIPVAQTSEQKLPTALQDMGEEPLNLSGISCLFMDWKNDEKMLNYVMVKSKELDYDVVGTDNFSCKTGSECRLERCLQLFTEPEVLSPQEAWYCPNCKDHREATKQLSLWRLPPVLIIQLKRFSFKNLLFRDKIDKLIEFPVRDLDLSPYVCRSTDYPPIYDLYAVVNHHGNILGGHYTAFARCIDLNNTRRSLTDWRFFDDSNVRMVAESAVMTKSAYVLFYRQRSVPFTLPQQLAATRRATNKEQKDRENMMDLTGNVSSLFALDSNIITDLTSESVTEMDVAE